MEKTEGGKPGFVLSLQAHLNTVFAASLKDAKLQAGVRTFHSAVIHSTPSLFFINFFFHPSSLFSLDFLLLNSLPFFYDCNALRSVMGYMSWKDQ